MMKILIQLRKKTWLPIKRRFWIKKYAEGFRMADPVKVFHVKQRLEEELVVANTTNDEKAILSLSKALSVFNEVIKYGRTK
jgi:hypothetical protein